MADTETIEGVIKKVTKKDGEAFGLTLDGHEGYLNYSKPEYRGDVWDAHKEGDTVKMVVGDGKWISKIKVTAAAQADSAPDGGVRVAGYRAQSPDDFRSLHRLEALKLAQADFHLIGASLPAYADVVARAGAYADFIEGVFDAQPTPPDSDPGWE